MTIPKDIGRPPRPDDGSCLYRLPEEFRSQCEAAVAAGHAQSASEYWYYEQRGETPNLAVVRLLLTAILRAAPDDKSDPRNEAQRLDVAMKAIYGRAATSGSNEKNDDELLQDVAWRAEISGASHDELRGIAREVLETQKSSGGTIESTVRRLVRKFDADPEEAAANARGYDPMPQMLEQMALRKIASLLHSIGVPTAISEASM